MPASRYKVPPTDNHVTRRHVIKNGLAVTGLATPLTGALFPCQLCFPLRPLRAKEIEKKAPKSPVLGVHLPLWHQGNLQATTFWPTLFTELKQHNISHCQILLYRFVDPVTGMISPQSRYKAARSPELDFLEFGLKSAQENEISAGLYPMLEIDNQQNIGTVWRGFMNFFGVTLRNFFHQYQELMTTLADMSARHQATSLYIGSELASLTHNIAARPHWQEMIHQLTSQFRKQGIAKTKLTYAAHWEEYLTVPFWRQLDEIGINAYFPLSTSKTASGLDKPEIEELTKSWQVSLNRLEAFAQEQKRPLSISEFGLTANDQSSARPWDQISSDLPDPGERKRSFEALLSEISGKGNWLSSVHLWHWQLPGRKGSTYNIQPKGPIAELISNYGRLANR